MVFAFGEPAMAFARSAGSFTTRGFVSSSIATRTVSPCPALAPACICLFTVIKCVPVPLGWTDVRMGKLFILPMTRASPRVPSLALARFGNSRNVQAFPGPAPTSLPLNVILAIASLLMVSRALVRYFLRV
jgi:hypothetical protein